MTNPRFLMATNGHCFFCLQPPKSKETHEETHQSTTVTLQNMFQYLKINLKEVYSEASAVPLSSSYLEVLGRSEVRGTLCTDCAQLSEHFSRYFRELEVIQRKLLSYLKSIHNKMTYGGRCLEDIKEEMLSRPENLLQYKVVEGLRNKTVDKCNRKLSNFPPPVDLRRLVEDKQCLALASDLGTEKNERVPESDQAVEHPKSQVMPFSTDACSTSPAFSAVTLTQREDTTNNDNEPMKEGHPPFEMNHPDSLSSKFKCSECPMEFVAHSDSDVQSHFRKVHPNSKWTFCSGVPTGAPDEPTTKVLTFLKSPITGHYKCPECPMERRNLWQAQAHFVKMHLKLQYKCSKCERTFSEELKLQEHQQTCLSSYPCKFCSKSFHFSRNLELHMPICPTRKLHEPECVSCNRKFETYELLLNHNKNFHNCSYCKKTFNQKGSRDRHMRSCSKRTAPTPSQEESRSRDDNHMKVNGDLVILPDDVDEELQDEEMISLPDNVPQEMCPEESGSEPPVTSSKMLKLFKCDLCDRKFLASELLLSHKKNVHNCRNCGNTYVHKRSKDRHERSCSSNLKNPTPSQEESYSRDGNPMSFNDDLMILPNDVKKELRDEDEISLPDDVPPPPEMSPEEAQVDPLSQENDENEEHCQQLDKEFATKDEPDSEESDVEMK